MCSVPEEWEVSVFTLPMQVVPRATEQFQPALSVVLGAGFLFVYC